MAAGKMKLLVAWESLWNTLRCKGSAEVAFSALMEEYARPPRAYHNLNHIAHCLDEFQASRQLALDPDAVEWALWFHDAIYDSRAKDNEQRSAELAKKVAEEAGLPDGFGAEAAKLIMATTHAAAPAPGDVALITDIDLAILGQPQARFDEYELEIREEYGWVDDVAFAGGRAAVLTQFAARPLIFQTEWFRGKYERQARANLTRALATWTEASLRHRNAGPTA